MTEQARTVGMDDHELYDVALRNIQEMKDPTFQYLVTIQNHGPYESRKFGSDIEEYLYFQDYSTNQLVAFVNELKELDEPTIVMFFGDHTPSLNRNNDETSDEKLLHQTPFFIWANYNTGYGHGEAELTTPNYLGVFLCRTMGISNEWYNDLGMLYGEYPVLAFTNNETAENVTKDFYLSDSASEKYKTYVYSCLEMLLK